MCAKMTKKLLVGSCVLLFCLMVLLPSPVEASASQRRQQQVEELLKNNGKLTTPQLETQPPQPKPVDPQPNIEVPHDSESPHNDATKGDDQIDMIGATIISIFVSLGWVVWRWFKRPIYSASPAPPAPLNADQQTQEQQTQEQEDQEQVDQDQEQQQENQEVNEENSPSSSSSSSSSPSPPPSLLSPDRSSSSSSSSSAEFLFSPSGKSRPSSSSSSSSSNARSSDLTSASLIQEFQERYQEPVHPAIEKMIQALLQLHISNHEELREKMDAMYHDLQAVKSTSDRVETGVEKNKAMQKDSREAQRKQEEDRKIKAFDRIKLAALSWWMISILITCAFLLWGNDSNTIYFDLWTIVPFAAAAIPSLYFGVNMYNVCFFVVIFLMWANSSAVLFIALRTTLTSFVQLGIFHLLTSALVGKYLHTKIDIIRNERSYKVSLIVFFILLGIALGWFSMLIPASTWEMKIVEWIDQFVPTLPQIAALFTSAVGWGAVKVFGSPFSYALSFL